MITTAVRNLIQQSVGKGNKFDPCFIPIVAILKTVGVTDADVSMYLGVKPATIAKWKRTYPAFKEAMIAGKKASANYLLATAFREATGYDYVEVTSEGYTDPETGEWLLREKRRVTKHARANPELLKWMLIIIKEQFPEYDFRDSHKIEVESKTLNVDLKGDLEATRIRELAKIGLEIADKVDKKTKVIESTVVDDED